MVTVKLIVALIATIYDTRPREIHYRRARLTIGVYTISIYVSPRRRTEFKII